jgi:autotransporter translocation and assembly factor TamB
MYRQIQQLSGVKLVKTLFSKIVVCALTLGLFCATVLAADLTGTWTGQITGPAGEKHELTLKLKSDGAKVTGSITGGPPTGAEQPIANGKLEGDQLEFEVQAPGPGGESLTLTYKGKVSGNKIQGSNESPMGSLPWEATKQ